MPRRRSSAGPIQGPYFTTAYIAKAIEVALIVAVAVDFARIDGNPVTVVRRELAALRLASSPAAAAPPPPAPSPDHPDQPRSPTDMKRLTLALGLVALAAVLAACSGASAAPATSDPGRRRGPGRRRRHDRRQGHQVQQTPASAVTAGKPFAVVFDNQDGAPHNIAISDASGAEVFKGEIVSSDARSRTRSRPWPPARTPSSARSIPT